MNVTPYELSAPSREVPSAVIEDESSLPAVIQHQHAPGDGVDCRLNKLKSALLQLGLRSSSDRAARAEKERTRDHRRDGLPKPWVERGLYSGLPSTEAPPAVAMRRSSTSKEEQLTGA